MFGQEALVLRTKSFYIGVPRKIANTLLKFALPIFIAAQGLAQSDNIELNASACNVQNEAWIYQRESFRLTGVGRCLMKLPYGLHSVEEQTDGQNDILIGIHGFKAVGGEWVEPFVTLDTDKLDLFYFRWNYLGEQGSARKLLMSELDQLIEERNNNDARITIIGHSCGGVLITSLLSELDFPNPIEVHLVATPLRGLGLFTVCKPRIPNEFPKDIEITQWRTQKHLDAVFWYFPSDPQDFDIPSSKVIRLPLSIEGKRLGHVRSLEWVSSQLAREQMQPSETIK